MDRYEGPATLEWWANPSMCLGEFTVQMAVELGAESGWGARAVLSPPLDDDDREAFEFYMASSPFFTLRLPDESTIAVAVLFTPTGLRLVPDDGRVPDPGPVAFQINSEGRFEAGLGRGASHPGRHAD